MKLIQVKAPQPPARLAAALVEIVARHAQDGSDPTDDLAHVLDAGLQFTGPVGAFVETVDGPLFDGLAELVAHLVRAAAERGPPAAKE